MRASKILRACRPSTRAFVPRSFAVHASLPVAARAMRPALSAVPVPTFRFGSVRAFASETETMVPVPEMGDSITEGTILEWVKEAGDVVAMDDVVVVIETDKVSVDVRSPAAGVIVSTLGEPDDVVEVGKPLFSIDTTAAAPAVTFSPAPEPATAPKEDATPASVPTSTHAPSAEPASTTAPAASAAPPPAAPKAAPAPSPPAAAPPSAAGSRTETRVKMTRMRQTVSKRLKEAQNTYAMLTTFQECDMGNLIDLRKQHKDEFEKKHGVKLGFMSAFVLAATAALKEVPAINATIDDATQEIVYKDYCDVSVAVASPKGLVVPVLRDTQNMSFKDVETSIADYAAKAKSGSLAMEDMVGGTFTISNGGVFGSLYGTPIINMPQAAILGMHATKMRPMVVNGAVVPRPMMYLALTYDHRLVDGREAVTFLKSVANKIEDPNRLLLDL